MMWSESDDETLDRADIAQLQEQKRTIEESQR